MKTPLTKELERPVPFSCIKIPSALVAEGFCLHGFHQFNAGEHHNADAVGIVEPPGEPAIICAGKGETTALAHAVKVALPVDGQLCEALPGPVGGGHGPLGGGFIVPVVAGAPGKGADHHGGGAGFQVAHRIIQDLVPQAAFVLQGQVAFCQLTEELKQRRPLGMSFRQHGEQLREGEDHPAVAAAPGDAVVFAMDQAAHVSHDLLFGQEEQILVVQKLPGGEIEGRCVAGHFVVAAQEGYGHVHVIGPDGVIPSAEGAGGGAGLLLHHVMGDAVGHAADVGIGAGGIAAEHQRAEGAAVVQGIQPAKLLVHAGKAIALGIVDGVFINAGDLLYVAEHIIRQVGHIQAGASPEHAIERHAQGVGPAGEERRFHIGAQGHVFQRGAPHPGAAHPAKGGDGLTQHRAIHQIGGAAAMGGHRGPQGHIGGDGG